MANDIEATIVAADAEMKSTVEAADANEKSVEAAVADKKPVKAAVVDKKSVKAAGANEKSGMTINIQGPVIIAGNANQDLASLLRQALQQP